MKLDAEVLTKDCLKNIEESKKKAILEEIKQNKENNPAVVKLDNGGVRDDDSEALGHMQE